MEQQLLNSELAEALRSQPRPKASKAAPTKSRDSHVTASAELQHCLELAPEVSLFGLHVDHLKAAVEEGSRNEVGVVRGGCGLVRGGCALVRGGCGSSWPAVLSCLH